MSTFNVERTCREGGRLHPIARRALMLAPVLAFLVTIPFRPPHRSQEARVLETAREMVGGGWRAWMVPHVNGRVRLQKPPLAYWLTAASFKTFGVSVSAGRLPMAFAGVLMLGATYLACRWLFERDAASLAWAALAGCLLFARLGQHAETDILAAAFTTISTYALWRAWAAFKVHSATSDPAPPRDFWWHHLAGVGIALAVLAKGPPAVFPPLFLLGLVAVEGGWTVLWRFVRSGAPLVVAAVALPWFVYVARVPQSKILASEIAVVAEGGGHPAGPLFYLLDIFVQTAPWAGFASISLALIVIRWRTDWRYRGLLVWLLTVLIPLSLIGQKQSHYTMSALPPLAILVGWCIQRATCAARDDPLRRATGWVVIAMLAVVVAVIPAPLVAGHILRAGIQPIDLLMGTLTAAVAITAWILHARSGMAASAPWIVGAGAVIMITGINAWAPSLHQTTVSEVSRELKTSFGDGPYAFYPSENLPLVFEMRQLIPEIDRRDLDVALDTRSDLLIIAVNPNEKALRRLDGFERLFARTFDRKQVEVYRAAADDGEVRPVPGPRAPVSSRLKGGHWHGR